MKDDLLKMHADRERYAGSFEQWSAATFFGLVKELREELAIDAKKRGVEVDPDRCTIRRYPGKGEDGVEVTWLVASNETGEEVAARNIGSPCPPNWL